MAEDGLPGGPLCHYLRYDVDLDAASLEALLDRQLTEVTIRALRALDDPRNLQLLHDIGTRAAALQIPDKLNEHFPNAFDLNYRP